MQHHSEILLCVQLCGSELKAVELSHEQPLAVRTIFVMSEFENSLV